MQGHSLALQSVRKKPVVLLWNFNIQARTLNILPQNEQLKTQSAWYHNLNLYLRYELPLCTIQFQYTNRYEW